MVRKKQVIIGGICIIGVLSVGMFTTSKIKHGLVENINIESTNYEALKNNMVAMYTSEDGENYTEIEGRMPSTGYIINEEKSYCNLNGSKDDNAILKTVDGNHVISNLIKGDKCYLYFDKHDEPITIPDIIAANNPKDETPDFSQVATTDEGVFKVEDGMYGGNSYYWRGATTTNYVKFANYCWRIVRINGDGSIRLIYDGESCHANGTSTAESIAKTSQTYSKGAVYDRSEYVGYTYTVGSQRGTTEESNLKTQTESWFNTNITGTNANKVATGKFCNDRNTASGSTWSSQPSSTFYYAARGRLESAKTPTLSCSNASDVYSLKAGAITADEVAFAGGVYGTANSSYYLYNGQYYWTMSPYRWYYSGASSRGTQVFLVYYDGHLNSDNGVYWKGPGVRPIINLLSNTEFKSGTDGTLNNPYEVI